MSLLNPRDPFPALSVTANDSLGLVQYLREHASV